MGNARLKFIELFDGAPEKYQNIGQIGSVKLSNNPDFPQRLERFVAFACDPTVENFDDAVLEQASIRAFFSLRTFDGAPSDWIRGISTFHPSRNAMNGALGSVEDRHFISANRIVKPVAATSVKRVVRRYPHCCWLVDAEGADTEIVRQLLLARSSPMMLFESALAQPLELLELRGLAVALNFCVASDKEDTLFFQPTIMGRVADV